MPLHAADPVDLSGVQAITIPITGIEETSLQGFLMDEFLDRLMAAESGGHLNKKNPRSTALGPFQFIKSTFLFVVNNHFSSEVAGLTEPQILALRTNMAFSRRVARAYTNDLIATLKAQHLPATPVNVRIAFLVGPAAAVRLLKTPTDQSLKRVLSADALAANPYMSGATVRTLIQKAAADVRPAATARPGPLRTEQAVNSPVLARAPAALHDEPRETISAEPVFEIKCDVGRASCRRWIALQEKAQLHTHSTSHR
jgi:hypothetical protein